MGKTNGHGHRAGGAGHPHPTAFEGVRATHDPSVCTSVLTCPTCRGNVHVAWDWLFAVWGQKRDFTCPNCDTPLA